MRNRNNIKYKIIMGLYNFSPIKTAREVTQIITGFIVVSMLFAFVFIFLPNFIF